MATATADADMSSFGPESPGDDTDANIPCKGCGEILEEGKAFELAGNRWHIDCFRCNTCGLLLDSDANLLLLGDGSLICNNCTYSCNACGNKIEDLAILTGDQAFCAACFRCRNCKKKIENLKYARTSQGIFCMACHETLMARRRKRVKNSAKTPTSAASASGPPVLDKSLPALPPTQLAGPDAALDEVSSRSPTGSRDQRSRLSPVSVLLEQDALDSKAERQSSSKNHRSQRRSSISSLGPSDAVDDDDDDDSRGFLPMQIDTSLVQSRTPDSSKPPTNDLLTPDHYGSSRDYFVNRNVPSSQIEHDTGGAGTAKSHVAFQEKGRSNRRSTSDAATPNELNTSPPVAQQLATITHNASLSDDFQLGDPPRTRSRKGSTREATSPGPQSRRQYTPPTDRGHERSGQESPDSGINPFDDPKLLDSSNAPPRRPAAPPTRPQEPTSSFSPPDQSPASSSPRNHHFGDAQMFPPRTHSKPPESPLRKTVLDAPQRSAARVSAPSKSVANDDFIAPRQPPAPPIYRERRNESIHSIQSDSPISPIRSHFSRHNLSADYNAEDNMRNDSGGDNGSSMLRRVSNAMRHGRSYSERTIDKPHHRKTSSVGQLDISGPINISSPVSPYMREDGNVLRNQLHIAQLRISELESEKARLEEKAGSAAYMSNFTSELRERRSTMAYLDTQRELAVRELETMTEHLVRARDTNQPFDIATLKNDILHDLSVSLQRLKDQLAPQIEDMVHRRNELTDDITNLIKVKDKGLQEFESLSIKNAQLNNLNVQLEQSLQDSSRRGLPSGHNAMISNGLGIHHVGHRPQDSQGPMDIRPTLRSRGSNDSPASHMSHDTPEVGEATVVSGPQMVNIRKGQQKRFNWKKGGRDVAKNMTKGIKGAFARDEGNGLMYSQPYPGGPAASDSSSFKSSQLSEASGKNPAQGLAFFQKNGLKGPPGAMVKNTSMSNLVVFEPSVLFGSELVARCDHENRIIPAIVNRCIQEVEARGMDVEGIYRKSGGSGQVQTLQKGFDQDSNYDISDPDLDIHAVTSCLKQYFRKLPNPLITFEVYDSLLLTADIKEPEKKCQALKAAIGTLPQAHRDVLGILVDHLVRVVGQQSANLMTPLNISVVFAPTIMRPLTIEREMTDMMAQRETVRALLDHASVIFD